MGRLLRPGVGEIADRCTILTLKCTRAPEGTDVTHFREELVQLRMRLDQVAITEELRQQIARLTQVNTALWEAEDRMAEHAADFDQTDIRAVVTCAAIGVYIWQTNRERNQIIAEINRLAGTDRGPEKL